MTDRPQRGIGEAEGGGEEGPPEILGLAISGRVADFTDVPLTGVRVEVVASGGADLDLLPVLTDASGRFQLAGLAEGRYDLRFVLGGVRARTLSVPAGTADLLVRLARPMGILLVVKTPEGEPPPDLLHVVLVREGESGPRREYVGHHLATRLLLWSIRPGRYTLLVRGAPYAPVVATGIEVVEGQPAPEVQVLLAARGASLDGRVVDREGRGIPRALIAWRPLGRPDPWPRQLATAVTDEDGRFLLRGLPEGRVLLSVGLPLGPFADEEHLLVAGESRPVEIRLG